MRPPAVADAHLDALTRSLAEGHSRRALARLLALAAATGGGLLLLIAPSEGEGKKRRSRKQRKRKRRRKASHHHGGGGDGTHPDAPAQRPFPQHVTYTGGAILPNHLGRQQLDDDVRAAYDRWKQRYLVPVSSQSGASLYRVAFGKPGTPNHDTTVSEGQGYGMVIVPLMAGHDPQAQSIFDGLWRYALAYRSCGDDRLMLWRIPNREKDGCASATDGDLDIAYGLLLAHAQWGSGGAIDYRAAANRLLAGILAATVGPQSKLPLLGDWVDPNGNTANQWTPRTSDFMTGHFRAFGRATGDAVWQQVVDASLGDVQALQDGYSADTGLLPDFVQPKSDTDHAPRPASPGFLERPNDGAYNYNAGRDPWRLGTDGLLNGDARALPAVARIGAWAQDEAGGDPQQIRAGYALDGTPLSGSDYFTTFFAAPLGVAA